MSDPPIANATLFKDIRNLIDAARHRSAVALNAELVTTYWRIGQRIRQDILASERAEYGQAIVSTLSRQLSMDYGAGFSAKNLHRMVQFAAVFPDGEKVATLSRQLSWSHFRELIPLEKPHQREFYLEICRKEGWSVRRLRERIQSMLYERTALSRKPEETIAHDLALLGQEGQMTPDLAFRDPYMLDFLGLADSYSEKDLESAIIAELQRFLVEMGSDFAFMARQKRIVIDHRDYYIDLLFYHRRLRRLVAIDLKIGEFEAAFKGQMELYLRYLARHEQVAGENTPIGLILCTGKNEEHIELLQLDQSNIRVAEYLTELPPREVLRAKLHTAIETARHKLLKESGS
ncbi:MAG: cytoplasmic protein [Desulfatitalea sp. BRH_c12]|nr:MAG: cytoplasmic protein [Desulfatitalea sp. BRH_c12]